ncbi:hypothetical protein Tco_1234870 [Tanacetum coccineum]
MATGGGYTIINLWHDSTAADKAKEVKKEDEVVFVRKYDAKDQVVKISLCLNHDQWVESRLLLQLLRPVRDGIAIAPSAISQQSIQQLLLAIQLHSVVLLLISIISSSNCRAPFEQEFILRIANGNVSGEHVGSSNAVAQEVKKEVFLTEEEMGAAGEEGTRIRIMVLKLDMDQPHIDWKEFKDHCCYRFGSSSGHTVDIDDINTVVHFINNRARPWTTLMVGGFVYGANMLTEYLAEVGEDTPLMDATSSDVVDVETLFVGFSAGVIQTFRKNKLPKLWQIERSVVLAEYGGPKMVDSAMITIVIELLDAMNKFALFLRKRYDRKTLWVISCITSLRFALSPSNRLEWVGLTHTALPQ